MQVLSNIINNDEQAEQLFSRDYRVKGSGKNLEKCLTSKKV